MSRPRQRIRFLRASDGVQLAWAEAGTGPVLVKAANWMTHLEYEWESPVWRHWIEFFSGHFRFIRYDERGCGMSDWEVGKLSAERWIDDLEEIIDAAAPGQPVSLLGISQGAVACIGYAARHPERVSRIVLYGGYARGFYHRGRPDAEREYRAIIEVLRIGWGKENPAFRQIFTSRFIPGGTPEQLAWFNDLCRKTTTGEMAAELMEMRAALDVTHLMKDVRAPTLVIHATDDAVCRLPEGRLLATGIASAQFVELPSSNHVLLADEPAWPRFQESVLDFFGFESSSEAHGQSGAFATLSPRERQILELLSGGIDNSGIAGQLSISEKTVRNHISRIYDKLGVWTRAQAVVFAREHGFGRTSK